jgi:hypothetical protein
MRGGAFFDIFFNDLNAALTLDVAWHARWHLIPPQCQCAQWLLWLTILTRFLTCTRIRATLPRFLDAAGKARNHPAMVETNSGSNPQFVVQYAGMWKLIPAKQ